MFKKKPSRTREFRRNNQVIDIEEARRERQRKREEMARRAEEQRQAEEARKKSARKRKKRRQRALIYFGAFLLIVALLVLAGWNIISLQMEKARLKNEQQTLTAERDDLQQELESINDPQYIEQQARQQLKLIMPGETLYILPTLPEKEESSGDK